MTQFIVGFFSANEQMFVAAQGETPVHALGALTDHFGEGVAAMYESMSRELVQISDTISEDEERDRLAIFRGEVPDPDVPVPQAGKSAVDPPPRGDTPADEPSGAATVDGPTCVICGTAITPDRALASKITIGEERCVDCTA